MTTQLSPLNVQFQKLNEYNGKLTGETEMLQDTQVIKQNVQDTAIQNLITSKHPQSIQIRDTNVNPCNKDNIKSVYTPKTKLDYIPENNLDQQYNKISNESNTLPDNYLEEDITNATMIDNSDFLG